LNHESDSLACGSVGLGEEGVHLDTADTVALDHAELDVSLVSPGGSPRVLDEPVVATVLGTVADGKDGVIEVESAGYVVQDTRGVVFEAILSRLNCNSSRLLSYGGFHLGHIIWIHQDVIHDGNGSGRGRIVLTISTLSISRSVRINRLKLGIDAGLIVLVGLYLITTLATMVLIVVALDELLLRERK